MVLFFVFGFYSSVGAFGTEATAVRRDTIAAPGDPTETRTANSKTGAPHLVDSAAAAAAASSTSTSAASAAAAATDRYALPTPDNQIDIRSQIKIRPTGSLSTALSLYFCFSLGFIRAAPFGFRRVIWGERHNYRSSGLPVADRPRRSRFSSNFIVFFIVFNRVSKVQIKLAPFSYQPKKKSKNEDGAHNVE